MASAILFSNAVGHGFYKDDDELLYMRVVHEGMPPFDDDGEANDPRQFFSKVDAAYLVSVHSKALSSKRSELSGVRGIRNIFDTVAPYNLRKVTDEDKEAADKWAYEMRGK